MPLRTLATFESDLPDEAQWNDRGDLIRPGGENIALEIRSGLIERGHRSEDVTQRSFYGWEFMAEIAGMRFHFVLAAFVAPQWLLSCEPRQSWWRRIFGKGEEAGIERGPAVTHEALASNSHFSRILWHEREAFERGKDEGAELPDGCSGLPRRNEKRGRGE